MIYNYTRSDDPQARGKRPQHLTKWKPAQGTIESLLQWAYVQGMAFITGTFDLQAPLEPGEYTHRNARLWTGSQLILLDVDNVQGLSVTDILNDPFIQSHAAALFPSSSYTENTLKLHILIPLTRVITDKTLYRRIGNEIAARLTFPVDTATLNPVQATYGTDFLHESMKNHVKGLNDGLCRINDSVIPVDPDTLIADSRISEINEHDLSIRAKSHAKAEPDLQVKIVCEALSVVLDSSWGEQERDERLYTIMSAFQGSNDDRVLETFLNYSSPRWDSSTQKRTLVEWWTTHKPREGGITVASLFNQAKSRGWLQTSSVELQNAVSIYAEEIETWLLAHPLEKCILLKSGTGTGKTQAAIKLLKKMQSENAETRAVFFAPSIKLCHALSASLLQAGIENTLYIEGGRKTKDKETLRSAGVLVTTLQTFAVKAYAGEKTITYDLVVMDECDELLSAFVRSGISRRIAQSSHVDSTQAWLGVDALIHLFETSKQLLLLDGTMTDLSRYIASQWVQDIGIYENTFKREKAPVTLYASLQTIRDNIIDEVRNERRVVIACDTKAEAALIEHLLVLTDSIPREQIIRITGDTASDQRVNTFFKDVETCAKEYPVVIYNSAMGSGVSIIETQPDIVYLISTYLAPRKLLQMLNRYRKQTEVRAFVQPRESLYHASAYERYAVLQRAAVTEEKLTGIERLKRGPIAQVISAAALLTATDDFEQHRSVKDFFIKLLEDDGRTVSFHEETTLQYTNSLKTAKEIIRAEKTEVRRTWRQVDPIKRGDSFPDDISTMDAAKGLLHGYIDDLFPNHADTDLQDDEIARLALTYGKHKSILKRWINPESIMQNTLKELHDTRKESVTYRLYMARVELLTQLNVLFNDLEGSIDDSEIGDNALKFLEAVREREAVYDLIAPANAPFSSLIGTPEQRAIKVARVILKSVGLGTKRGNGKRVNGSEKRERKTHIRNLEDIKMFSQLAGIGSLDSDFGSTQFQVYREKLVAVVPLFNRLSESSKTDVLYTLQTVDNSSFIPVVKAQEENRFAG